jgi:hypothetical protein
MRSMSVAFGVIRHGQLVLEGDEEPLPEGKRVTVLIEDDDEVVPRLSEEQVKLLIEAQDSIRRGEYVTMEQALKDLDEE